jgi:hypothetical protein
MLLRWFKRLKGKYRRLRCDPGLKSIRTQLDECTRTYYRYNPRLYQVEAKRAFLAAMPGGAVHVDSP